MTHVHQQIHSHDITGLILAGGQGRRMGGADKGLVDYRGRPLAAWTLERLRPQVGAVLISANRNQDIYGAWGAEVIGDRLPDYPGPLAGVHAALQHMHTPWLVTCPCDSPFLPLDLVSRLARALEGEGVPMAVAHSSGKSQPAFMLVHRRVLMDLDAYLAAGERRFTAWQGRLGAKAVNFEDRPTAFANFNTPEDLISVGTSGAEMA